MPLDEVDSLPMDSLSLDDALQLGNQRLDFEDGRSLCVHRDMLTISSVTLRGLFMETESTSGLHVDGNLEEWKELLRLLYHGVTSFGAPSLNADTAYRIFPIAHQYDMPLMLKWCLSVAMGAHSGKGNADRGGGLSSGVPAAVASMEPLASSGPSMLHWLALGDRLQYDPLIRACLSHMSQGGVTAVTSCVRTALSSVEQRGLLEGLRAETAVEVMKAMAGLPFGFQGPATPKLGKTPIIHCAMTLAFPTDELGEWCQYRIPSCMSDSLLFFPVYHSGCEYLVAWDIDAKCELRKALVRIGPDDSAEAVENLAVQRPGSGGSGSQLVLATMGGGSIAVWDVGAARRNVHLLPWQPPYEGSDVQIIPCCWYGGNTAVWALGDVIKVWDLDGGQPAMPDMGGDRADIWGLASSVEGSVLLSADSTVHGTSRLWDMRTGRCVRMLVQGESVSSVAIDAAGRSAVSAGHGRTVSVWDLGSGRRTASLEGHSTFVRDLAMDRAGTTAMSSYLMNPNADAPSPEVIMWDLTRSKLSERFLPMGKTEDSTRRTICANPDLTTVALVECPPITDEEGDAMIKVWRH